MICRNCGYRNEKGDEFCGSCGQFLEWTGVAADEPEPQREPEPEPEPTQRGGGVIGDAAPSQRITDRPTKKTDRPPDTTPVTATTVPAYEPDVICWNCKSRNRAGRTFCMKCGERLAHGGGGGGMKKVALLVGVIGVIVLAGVAAAFFMGGGGAPAATGTPAPVAATPRPAATATPRPTPSPTPAITPTASRECATPVEARRTAQFSTTEPEGRSGSRRGWCVREVIFNAGSGAGVLSLRLTNPQVFSEVPDGTYEWLRATMPDDFDGSGEYSAVIAYPPPYELVPAGTTITLEIECRTPGCTGSVTISYDRAAAP